ncbi:MAG TPA: SPOCS domain-containing protein [Anaerovoracaceae bacterium]|nr:SPOCS domain-containing protein [Anaerovoracaceae bacterium]
MTYEKDPFKFEEIPEYALQPAKEADEYNFHYVPRGATNRFDPAAYEKVLHDSVKQAAESEQPELLDVLEENAPESFETATEFFPQSMEDILPVSFADPEEEDESETISDLNVEPVSAQPADSEEEPEETVETAIPAETPEVDEEEAPVFTAPVARPVFQPIFVPKTVPAKIVPAVGTTVSSKLKLIDMKKKEPLRMTIEEDILVPDVKPDLERILAMDGKIKLSEREIHTGQLETDSVRISGDLILQTLYVPEHMVDGEPIVAIESRIPFKNETEMKAGPYSDLALAPKIESIDFTVVNERKFRVRADIVFGVKEYSNVDIEVFEGVRDEEVQMLKEKINLTDVAMRKTESIEIKDDLTLKESMPDILKILKYDVNIVENHKQITKEKAVINASVYCNIMYLGADGNPDDVEAEDAGTAPEGDTAIPVLYQGKTEFTQFIRLDGDNTSDQNPAGSKVNFNIASINLTAKEDGNGKRNLFELDMNVDTGLELYKNIEKEVVTDVYHDMKEIQFETDEIGVMALGGSGVAEISVREIVNIPERYGNVDKVVYISGNIIEKRSFIDQPKSIVEGNIVINLICTSADTKKTAFNVTQEIPFRSAMEIPGITPEMTASNDIVLKELWFDKINNKQIEVNAGILVNTAVSSQNKHQLVKNISFLDSPQDNNPLPGIILYIARSGDTIWKVAKKYRTTIDELKRINEIEFGKEIKPGTKLLIVAKNH